MTTHVILIASLVAAVPAPFDYPLYVAVGPNDVIYVADQNLPAILKVTASATTTLFQGQKKYRTPIYRPRGLAVEASGNLLVCDPATMDVYRVTPDGKATPLTGKKVKLLNGVETTMGDVFVQPEGVAVAPDGTIYVSDLKLWTIFKIGSDNKPTKFANVPAPRGLAIDTDGSLLVISHSDAQLQRVQKDGKVVPVVSGRPFGFPLSIVVRADGSYLVTDNYSKALWRVTRDGKTETYVSGDPLRNPTGLAQDKAGHLIIADPHAQRLFRLSPEKKFSVIAERAK